MTAQRIPTPVTIALIDSINPAIGRLHMLAGPRGLPIAAPD
jgi:hypothetical protein